MINSDFSMTILYVNNVPKSAQFYQQILTAASVELSPTFCLFVLENGLKLGLWSKYTVEPVLQQLDLVSSSEVLFTVSGKRMVDDLYQRWEMELEVTIVHQPQQLDFGYAFVGLDIDGHRLRVCYLKSDE